MWWFYACVAPPEPEAVAPAPGRAAAPSLRPGGARAGPRFDPATGRLRHRGLSLRLGPDGPWTRVGPRWEQADGGLTRWWQPSAAGLEFGATLQAPHRRVAWPVDVPVEPDGAGGLYLRAPQAWLHVHGLRVVDADGVELPAHFGPGLSVEVDVRGARWPIEVDPLVSGDWAAAIPANALAWLDADADGYSEFAIGDAFDDGGSWAEGRVHVFSGRPEGPEESATWLLTAEERAVHYGAALAAGDFDGDGFDDLAVGMPGGGSSGEVELWYGHPGGLGDRHRLEPSVSGESFGMGALAADVDHDGFDDLFVTMSGSLGVWLYKGSARGLRGEPDWSLETPLMEGLPILSAGDLDADGWVDLVVGLEADEDWPDYQGSAWWLFGGPGGFGASADQVWSGDEAYAKCGHTVAVGDWNVDGYDDTAVSCPWHNEWYSYAGRLLVWYGSAEGVAEEPDWEHIGTLDDRELGLGLARVLDLDGDGDDELFVAGTGDGLDGPGQANIYTGEPGGLLDVPTWSWAGAGEAWVATIGEGGGDFDGDGFNDLLLGSGLIGEVGRSWLIPGSADGLQPEAPGWRADEAGSFADSIAMAGDLDGDGYAELLIGSTADDFGYGHAYVYPGMADGLGADPTDELEEVLGEAFGAAVVGLGDVDGDGWPDMAVGAPEADDSYPDEGRVELHLGDGAGYALVPAATLRGGAEGVGLGRVLRGPGDCNGDGYADLVLAQPEWDDAYTDEGRVELYGGAATGLESSPWVSLTGGQEGAGFGMSLSAAGDVDGDDRADLLIGAPGWTGTETGEGKVELWLGDARGLDLLPSWVVYGGAEGAEAGSVAGGGDLDGDGAPDVAVGAPALGEVRVYLGFGDTPDWTVAGEAEVEFGGTLELVGDLDGDGDDELAIGAPGWNESEGAAWLYTGQAGGPSTVAAMSWRGGWPGASFGAAFASGEDVDGDGLADLAISSPGVELVELWYGGPLDGDGDGARSDRDCDDTDPSVYPEAAETEDGRDEDCDGVIDDPPTWYLDSDEDGFGDDASAVASFHPEAGWVETGGDCDDAEAGVNPDALEHCDEVDEDCDGEVDEDATDRLDWYTDADGDGVAGSWAALACEDPGGASVDGSDCDDADPAVFPGAEEQCDGIDNDCSGVLDDSPSGSVETVFQDADGDGFGVEETRSLVCAIPEGWVGLSGDCDDADVEVNPLVPETCNGVDDDCSGVVDDDALDAVTVYGDGDGDTHGDTEKVYVGCDPPAGWVSTADDCDDTDPGVQPGVSEHCDGVDENCSGEADEDAVDGSTWYADGDGDGYGTTAEMQLACEAPEGWVDNGDDCDDSDPSQTLPTVWYDDVDGDGYGNPDDHGSACTPPAYHTSNSEDCDDSRADVNPAAAEVCDDADNDCDGEVDVDAVDIATWYVDADGDGYGDPDSGESGCDLPEGAVLNASDCNDADASRGLPTDWYADQDGDGWGDAAVVATSCPQPEAYVAEAGDCDDGDAAISPDAPELCDGVDQDCDGVADDDPVVAGAWYADEDGDGWGDPARLRLGCVAEAGEVANGLDCDDTDPSVSPGAAERWYDGVDQDCDGDDADQDGDGHPVGSDCDDLDSTAFPGAAELPGDGIDQDCDGADLALPKAEGPAEGCGCASGAAPAWLGLTALGLVRRRRR